MADPTSFGTTVLVSCWESVDGRCMHYFTGGPTCQCGKQASHSAKPEIRTHLRLVDEHVDDNLNL
jgi:hypothetical protein